MVPEYCIFLLKPILFLEEAIQFLIKASCFFNAIINFHKEVPYFLQEAFYLQEEHCNFFKEASCLLVPLTLFQEKVSVFGELIEGLTSELPAFHPQI